MMSFAVDGYVKGMRLEATIYETTLGTYLGLTTDQKQTLCDTIIEKSFEPSKYGRLHSVFVTALEKLPANLTSSKENWLKTIEILGHLLDEKDPYRISTECFFFKKYHAAACAGHDHPVVLEDFAGFAALKPDTYLAVAASRPVPPKPPTPDYIIQQKILSAIHFNYKTELEFFKFREAKKILNYLCQISQYFDEACWMQILHVIKSHASVIAGLKHLTLDAIEGNGFAAANLMTKGSLGRVLFLNASIVELFGNAKTPTYPATTTPAVKKLAEEAETAVGTP